MPRLNWPPWLAGGPEVPAPVQEKLLDTLFAPDYALRTGILLVTLTGLLTAARLRSPWPLSWVAAAVPILIYRSRLAGAYRRDHTAATRDVWIRRFALGGCGYAALWGLSGFAVAFIDDGFARMAIVSPLILMVQGFARRNNASPATALVQITGIVMATAVGCLLSGDWFMVAFVLFLGLQLQSGVGVVEQASQRTLRLLNAEYTAAGLLTDLKAANAVLAEMVTTDQLTDLVNRRGFEQALDIEWRRARREADPLSVLMIDVDHFKRYNDTYGHSAGDACLRRVGAALLSASRRPADVVARYGGEEFVMILPTTDIEGAKAVAEAARHAVHHLLIPHAGSDHRQVTVTIGCATLPPRHPMASSFVVQCADAALYEGKRLGRNRVAVASPGAVEALAAGVPLRVSSDQELAAHQGTADAGHPERTGQRF